MLVLMIINACSATGWLDEFLWCGATGSGRHLQKRLHVWCCAMQWQLISCPWSIQCNAMACQWFSAVRFPTSNHQCNWQRTARTARTAHSRHSSSKLRFLKFCQAAASAVAERYLGLARNLIRKSAAVHTENNQFHQALKMLPTWKTYSKNTYIKPD